MMMSTQERQNMQQQQDHQEGLIPQSSFFVNFNNGSLVKQPQQQQQQQQPKANPRFNGIMGQDSLFGQVAPMGLTNFQLNSSFAPNMDLMLQNMSDNDEKRKISDHNHEDFGVSNGGMSHKKARTEEPEAPKPSSAPAVNMTLKLDDDDGTAPAPVEASKEGISTFEENDVLSGRGGGTNVHPGNRNFRDLINMHRRSYLKARKNDKPAISRAIVRAIRESGGRFLKKGNKSNLWFEIGDDAAREKTSQALRQRAPEMRKLLFDSEREEARVVAEEQLRHQRMVSGGMNQGQPTGMIWGGDQDGISASGMMNPALLQAMAANNKLNGVQEPTNQQFSSMFSAALLQNGINRLASNGA